MVPPTCKHMGFPTENFMTFVRKKADITPIVDTVFSIVNKAKEDKSANGAENVIDATIGSLYG